MAHNQESAGSIPAPVIMFSRLYRKRRHLGKPPKKKETDPGDPKKIKQLCKIYGLSEGVSNAIALDGQLLDDKLDKVNEKYQKGIFKSSLNKD